MKKIILIILLPLIVFAGSHHEWTYNQNIYEVNIRQYTEGGTFVDFEQHLDRLHDMGVGILWFMPIHPIGEKNRLGSLGSYYSVKDFYGVNQEFGNIGDFKHLVSEIHNKGMYVIIDWVANHTAWDCDLTTSHSEWYVQQNGNFIPPPGTNWSDVIELDYSQQVLRNYMVDAMKYWIDECDIDGFRCDAVDMVPMDFWENTIEELKSHKPEVFMLAEGDGKHLETSGFDMTYGWGLYAFGNGLLKNIYSRTQNANDLFNYFTNQNSEYDENHYRMYFTSNHDENSWYGTDFENFGDAAETFIALTLLLDGMPLIYSGQEAGLDKRLAFFDKDQINWKIHSFKYLFSKLLKLKKSNEALWNGKDGGNITRISSTKNQDVLAFVREQNGEKILVLFNLSPNYQQPIFLSPQIAGEYINIFTNDTLAFQQGSNLELYGWEYQIYELLEKETAIINEESIASGFSLAQNYPNPFNPETIIQYSLPGQSEVELIIFDITGKKIKKLVSATQNAGNYDVTFNGRNLASGIYFYKITAGSFQQTKQMLMIK